MGWRLLLVLGTASSKSGTDATGVAVAILSLTGTVSALDLPLTSLDDFYDTTQRS